MGTSADKLNKLIQTKADIKDAIIEKGGVVNDSTPFGDYAQAIRDISGGGAKSNILDLGNFVVANPSRNNINWVYMDKRNQIYKMPDGLKFIDTVSLFSPLFNIRGGTKYTRHYGTFDLNNLEEIQSSAFDGVFSLTTQNNNATLEELKGLKLKKIGQYSASYSFKLMTGSGYLFPKNITLPELIDTGKTNLIFGSGYPYANTYLNNYGENITPCELYMPKLETFPYSSKNSLNVNARKVILPSAYRNGADSGNVYAGTGATSILERYDVPALEEVGTDQEHKIYLSGFDNIHVSTIPSIAAKRIKHINFTGLKKISNNVLTYGAFDSTGMFNNYTADITKVSFPKLEEIESVSGKTASNRQPFYNAFYSGSGITSTNKRHIYFPSLRSISSSSTYSPFYNSMIRYSVVHFPVNCPEKEKIQAYTDWNTNNPNDIEIVFDLDGILEFTGDPYWYELWIDGEAENLVVPYLNQQSFYCIDTQNKVYTTGNISSKGTIDLDSMLKNYNKVTYRIAGNRNDLEGWYTVEGHTYPIINNGDGTYETRHSSLGNSHELTYKFIGKGIEEIIGTITVGTGNMTVNINPVLTTKNITVNLDGVEGQEYHWQKSFFTIISDGNLDENVLYESMNVFGGSSSNPSLCTMKVEFEGYTNFTFKIAQSANESGNYCMVSQLDAESIPTTYSQAYYDTRSSKVSTAVCQPNSFKNVSFSNISAGKHHFYVTYYESSGTDSYADRGYILLPKYQ